MTKTSHDRIETPRRAERETTPGEIKAGMKFKPLFLQACLAGACIAFGAVFATTVSAGTSSVWPYGVTRVLMGVAFCVGLVLIVISGAELFTGNTMISIAWLAKRISTRALLRNWGIVYLGNLAGSVTIALLTTVGKTYSFGSGALGTAALLIANAKVNLGFWQAMALGVLCNFLVCLAFWLTYSAHTTLERILAIVFPITAFVAAGFEHSVANMYFIPAGLFIKLFDPAFAAAAVPNTPNLTWSAFLLNNLLPVTIGNIIGGAILDGLIYWAVYLLDRH